MSTTSSSAAGWLASAITSCQPLEHQHVEALIATLPGVESFAVALPVILPKQEHHILQTCFTLDLTQQPCTGRSAVFSGQEPLLARTVCGTGKALLCPANKSDAFADVKSLVKDASCSTVACLPLLQNVPTLEESSTPPQPKSRPFGSFCIAFRHGVIHKETVAAAHSLCRALATGHGDTLRCHAETIISCLNAPMHSSPADLDEDLDDRDVSNYIDEDYTDEASCSGSALLPSAQQQQHHQTSTSTPTAPCQSLWMTFKDPLLEAGYLEWGAQHMRRLDPASTVFVCTYFCAIGFSPSFAMALNYPLPWAAGWIILLPILLCMLPGINHFYVAHRELWLLVFHAVSLTWHVSTANTTKYLGPSLYKQISNNPASCFAWQFLNLVMFQVRWKFVLVIAFAMLVFDTIPLAPDLCQLFKQHQHVGVDDSECVQATIFYGAALLFAALVVLRVNECRMRRLYLNCLDDKKKRK